MSKKVLPAFILDSRPTEKFLQFMAMYSEAFLMVGKDLIIKLSRKEGEMKPDGQRFGQTTSENRFRMQIMEYNVKRFQAEYDPQQAMTPSHIELVKKMYAFRRLQDKTSACRTVFFKVDCSKWNNRFSHGGTNFTRSFLNDIYGAQYWTNMMQAFMNTDYYAPTLSGCYKWSGQFGGIEGLQQNRWMISYGPGMALALERLGYMYSTMKKGDDWISAVQIPKDRIAAHPEGITGVCNEMNNIESFYSSSLISFSKEFQLQDTWGSNLLKKGSKIHPFDNSILPTTTDSVASIFSNAHSCAGTTTTASVVYFIA